MFTKHLYTGIEVKCLWNCCWLLKKLFIVVRKSPSPPKKSPNFDTTHHWLGIINSVEQMAVHSSAVKGLSQNFSSIISQI